MPSRDLYALKGLVCPQGIRMPSKDLCVLKGLGPRGAQEISRLGKTRPPSLRSRLATENGNYTHTHMQLMLGLVIGVGGSNRISWNKHVFFGPGRIRPGPISGGTPDHN